MVVLLTHLVGTWIKTKVPDTKDACFRRLGWFTCDYECLLWNLLQYSQKSAAWLEDKDQKNSIAHAKACWSSCTTIKQPQPTTTSHLVVYSFQNACGNPILYLLTYSLRQKPLYITLAIWDKTHLSRHEKLDYTRPCGIKNPAQIQIQKSLSFPFYC